MLTWTLENTVMAAGLAVLVMFACRMVRFRPAFCHVLWALVVVRLVAPPLDVIPQSGFAVDMTGRVETALSRPLVGPGSEAKTAEAPFEESERRARPEARSTAWAPAPVRAQEADAAGATTRDAETAESAGRRAPSSSLTWNTVLLTVWVLGALLVLARHGLRIVGFRGLVRRAHAAPDWLTLLVRDVADRMGVTPPRAKTMPGLPAPAVWGLGRATLLWPHEEETQERLRCSRGIVAHELAHLKRRDHWLGALDLAASALLWWNPVYWFARARLRHQAELACDAWVVRTMPSRRRAYAEALIGVADAPAGRPSAPALIGFGDVDRRNFEWRLNLIMQGKTSCRAPSPLMLLAMLAVALIVPTPSGAQDAVLTSGKAAPSRTDKAVEAMVGAAIAEKDAERHHRAGDWESAVASYRTVLAADPTDGEVTQRLGRALMRLGRMAEGAATFRRQIELSFETAQGHYDLACALARQGDADGAFGQAKRAVGAGFANARLLEKDGDLTDLRDDPEFSWLVRRAAEAGTLRKKAGELFDEKEYQKALEKHLKLAKMTPENGAVWHRIAYCAIATGDHALALKACRKQAELGHHVEVAHYNAACAHARLGQSDEAFAYLEKAIENGFDRAKLLREDPDLESLRKDARFGDVAAEVVDTKALWKKAKVAYKQKDWATAIEHLSAITTANPEDSAAWTTLGVVHLAVGELASAMEAFQNDLRHGGDAPRALYNIACTQSLGGAVDEALSTLERAIRAGWDDEKKILEDPDLAAVRKHARFSSIVNRVADEKVLDSMDAVSWKQLHERYTRRVAERPDDGRAWLRLGWADLRLGNYAAAIKDFEKQEACGFAPAIARYNVACTHSMAGRVDEAFVWLKKTFEVGTIDVGHMKTDPDLAALRGDPRFSAFLASLAERPKKVEKD